MAFCYEAWLVVSCYGLLWLVMAGGILEDYDLKVMSVTSDDGAANRTMYRMHSEMKHTNNDKGVVDKTRNIYAEDIFFYL